MNYTYNKNNNKIKTKTFIPTGFRFFPLKKKKKKKAVKITSSKTTKSKIMQDGQVYTLKIEL